MLKMYIAVLESVPDHMVPVVVGHAVLRAHLEFSDYSWGSRQVYEEWLEGSFRKVVVKVNQKEFDRILQDVPCVTTCESSILEGEECCVVALPTDLPINTLKFAKLWKPTQ